jgi:hypothetical protein
MIRRHSSEAKRAAREFRDACHRRGTDALWTLQQPSSDEMLNTPMERIRHVALGRHEILLVLYEDGDRSWSAGLPRGLFNILHGRQHSLPPPVYCVLSPSDDRWYLEFADGSCHWEGDDDNDGFSEAIREKKVASVAFGEPNCWVVAFQDGSWQGHGLSDLHFSMLRAGTVSFVSLGPHNALFVRYESGKIGFVHAPQSLVDEVQQLRNQGHDIRQVLMSNDDMYFCRFS